MYEMPSSFLTFLISFFFPYLLRKYHELFHFPNSDNKWPAKYYVDGGMSTLISFSDGLEPSIFRWKMEKTRLMREGMNGVVFFCHQNWHFYFLNPTMKVFFLICALTWCVNNFICRQGKGIQRRNENTKNRLNTLKLLSSTSYFLKTWLFIDTQFITNNKDKFSLERCWNFSHLCI